MKVTTRTEKEIEEMNLWPAGEYGFEIFEAKDTISKVKPDGTGGNEMIELKLKVFNNEGGYKILSDYLLDIDSMAFKIRHACDACGLIDRYEAGQITANDFIGKTGYLKLRVQKDKAEKYPDKNTVQDYIVSDTASHEIPPIGNPMAGDTFNDPLPWEA